jgi:hypothetical protein
MIQSSGSVIATLMAGLAAAFSMFIFDPAARPITSVQDLRESFDYELAQARHTLGFPGNEPVRDAGASVSTFDHAAGTAPSARDDELRTFAAIRLLLVSLDRVAKENRDISSDLPKAVASSAPGQQIAEKLHRHRRMHSFDDTALLHAPVR